MSLHAAAAAVLLSVPIFIPTRPMNVREAASDFETEVVYQPLFLPTLPRLAETAPTAKPKTGPGQQPRSVAAASDVLPVAAPNRPKPDYAGAQEIVSNPLHSIKGVQTISRPDLITPPKLKYPVRLPSMVLLPPPAIRPPVQAKLERPKLEQSKIEQAKAPKLEEALAVQASESPVQVPARPKVQTFSAVRPEAVIPKSVSASEPSFAALTTAEVAPKSVVVINAVSVPPEPSPSIPDAEMASKFVVAPSTEASARSSVTGSADEKNINANESNKANSLSHPIAENKTETSIAAAPEAKGSVAPERSGASANVSNSGSSSNAAATSQPANNSPTSAANAAKSSLAGISISGGAPGRSGSGRAAAINPIPRGSYGLTVISSGSSGGASRDLGVFSRSDTVYTVYIPMTDAGGGPAWPMQYALASSAPTSNGLLTPPIVTKKFPATKLGVTVNSGPVFVTGIIDENGKFQALRAMRARDTRAQSAVEALAQWEFLPAQLDGKPVPSKVLIGVSVMRAEEVGKQH